MTDEGGLTAATLEPVDKSTLPVNTVRERAASILKHYLDIFGKDGDLDNDPGGSEKSR